MNESVEGKVSELVADEKKKRFSQTGLVWFGCLDVPVRELLLIRRPRIGLTRRKDSREGKGRQGWLDKFAAKCVSRKRGRT